MQVVQGTAIEALASGSSSPLPTEFRLLQIGENRTSKGAFKLDSAGLAAIMAAYKDQGVDLAIDYEHQTFNAAANGKPAPAAGWFKPEARADGLWATGVKWTDGASAMLKAKEYRYFSPTFEVDKNKRITRLLPIAITNHPATKGQEALVAATATKHTAATPSQEIKMSNLTAIIGLKDDAHESEIEGRVVALTRTEAKLLEITGKDNVGDAIGVVLTSKDAAVRLAAAEKALHEWEEREQAAKQEQLAKQISSMVDQAVLEGRVSLRDTDKIKALTAQGEAYGIECLKNTIAMLPSRPMRTYQAPPPANSEKAQLAAIEDYKKNHPGASTADAYIALSAERPALFAEGGR